MHLFPEQQQSSITMLTALFFTSFQLIAKAHNCRSGDIECVPLAQIEDNTNHTFDCSLEGNSYHDDCEADWVPCCLNSTVVDHEIKGAQLFVMCGASGLVG